ncbi:MAG: MAPEG family protein, partial [Candidatus Binatia bacterium]
AGERLAWAAQWALLPMLVLMISIMRVANHRFGTPEDIDGSGLTSGTPRILVLGAILQNTLEQAVLACAAYMIWAPVMPLRWMGAIPAAAVLFVAGRILFAAGYERGAPGRALGFGLTAYPTFGMLVSAAVVLLQLLLQSFIG